ncbi:HlyD family efflux transporter periplasmic adaptor subunit [Rhodospira trueperi]|uniref:Putative peptide zinc metalloprotease protein n=1 Tax=Rhodospira trueperi TaxID=69960 RepID=A0A1G7FFA9_9PROT|nr:HlyD family efflux transporter periplasmic adaptor subunit [Rhodospira trueperi]SDE74623.1 putative peptide zinc metalloprotease protein [Rhodospira trueperi]
MVRIGAASASALPPLRADLTLHPGPAGLDGAPSWTIGDPARNRYVRIDWPAFEMLTRWDLGSAPAVAAAVRGETTLDLTPDDVTALADLLREWQLTLETGAAASGRLATAARAARESAWAWLVHRYLFFRVPLVRPDRFLSATQGAVAWLGSPGFLALTLAVLALGLVSIVRQWDLFVADVQRILTPDGVAALLVALAGVKTIHELGHAYVAKRFGCRVPVMGIAFLVMIPMLYTDVNAAWTLPRRRQRLLIGAAGMIAELTVAAWATLAWTLLPEGPARQGAFVLAAVTWVSSLAINLSPFMRFDGYFLLMDALETPNLHARSFALARWRLREALFDLGDPPPEPLPAARRRGLILFAVATWLYRLIVFVGLAVLVYTLVFKAAGVVLFLIEIGWFIARPVARELRVWTTLRGRIVRRRRAAWTAGLVGLGLLAGLVPWTTRIDAPAVLKGAQTADLHVPFAARLARIDAREGDPVTAGAAVYTFTAPDIALSLDRVEARRTLAARELERAALDPAFRAHGGEIRERLAQAEAERRALVTESGRLALVAPFDGVLLDPRPDLRIGQWLSPRERLAVVRSHGPPVTDAYVDEADLARIREGAAVVFVPDAPEFARQPGHIVAIGRAPVSVLADAALASVHGGALEVRMGTEGLVPERALYTVRVVLDGPPPTLQLIGRVRIEGEPRSLFARLWRSILVVLVREWGT